MNSGCCLVFDEAVNYSALLLCRKDGNSFAHTASQLLALREGNIMTELICSRLDAVRSHTAQELNERIDSEIIENVRSFESRPTAIDLRIKQLELEWSLERILDITAASVSFLGILLGAFLSRWWLIFPVVFTGFLIEQAIQGWSPPLLLLRQLGKRTRKEIDTEKFALKALRGDFANLGKVTDSTPSEVDDIMEACAL